MLGLTSPIRQGDGRAVMWALKTLHGVALRDPLGEGRLVESCLGMPGEQFFDRGRPRLLIRRLLRGRVPPAFLSAPRGLQAADWHLRYTRALPRIRETLGDWRHDPAVAERLDLGPPVAVGRYVACQDAPERSRPPRVQARPDGPRPRPRRRNVHPLGRTGIRASTAGRNGDRGNGLIGDAVQ